MDEFYADSRRVVGLYQRWFDYAESRARNHAIVCLTDGIRFFSRDEWEEVARRCEGNGS